MYDEEIEKAMLSHILYNDYECDLDEQDFANAINKVIIKAINQLKNKKEKIDMINVKHKIKGDGEKILKYLSDLPQYAIGTDADDLYNKIIQLSQKRQIFEMIQKEITTIQDTPVEEIANSIERQINNIMQRNQKELTFMEQLLRTEEEIENKYQKRNDYSLYTGIVDLDQKILGLHNGELTIIGARPGVGKTTLALQIGQKIAERNKNVVIISLEMSDTQLIQKIISKNSSINSYKLRSGNIEKEDWDKLIESIEKISHLPLKIITNAMNIQKIEQTIKKLKNKNEVDLVIIDYIQLIKNKGKFNSREQEVADISRTLKLLTLELNIPIIALCQLNRNANKNEPTLADLRESGSIEQDADNVFFLYQEKEQESQIADITLKIAKQRTGETGKINLKFNKPKNEFRGVIK